MSADQENIEPEMPQVAEVRSFQLPSPEELEQLQGMLGSMPGLTQPVGQPKPQLPKKVVLIGLYLALITTAIFVANDVFTAWLVHFFK